MNRLAYQLKQLIKLLREAKVDYAVIGGLAVSVYGEPRLTWDIDVNILLGNSNSALVPFLQLSKKYGFTPIPPKIAAFAKKTGVLPMSFSKNKVRGRCDLIIAQNPVEYLTIQRARSKKIYDCKVKIASAEDLFIHKITSQRPRDIEDAKGILMRRGKRLDMRYVMLWLKKIARANNYPGLLTTFENIRKGID